MVSSALESLSIASSYRLYKYLWLSGLISLAIGGIIFGLAYGLSDDLGNMLASWWPWDWGTGFIESFQHSKTN